MKWKFIYAWRRHFIDNNYTLKPKENVNKFKEKSCLVLEKGHQINLVPVWLGVGDHV